MTIPGHLAPATSTNCPSQVDTELTPHTEFGAAEQELASWYHDGSNVTGWTYGTGSWTLNSTGTELYSPIVSSGAGLVHSVYYYELETDFVVGNDLKWEMQFNHTPNGAASGGINAMLYTGSTAIVWRFAASLSGTTGAMWALNYYTSNDYDSEAQAGAVTNITMWYNATNENTETDIGDGIVSAATHMGVTRPVTRVVLDFWWDDSMGVYGDLRMDWMRITGGARTEIDSPDDVEMEYSDTGRSILWTPEAYYPDTYELLINDTTDELAAWNGSALEFPLTNLDPGLYEYELVVSDELGMTATDSVWVNVTDTTAPYVFGPADFGIQHGTTGSYLSWICDEPYPDYFSVTRNGTLVEEGSWNGTNLRASLDGLDYGVHVHILSVNDTYGNTETDTVNVWVVDLPAPTITPLDDDAIELGTTGEHLNWSCDSHSPDYFIISHNGTPVSSGSWNGSYLMASLDNLDFGPHSFTLFVNDTYGNEASDVVIIVVEDTTLPTLDAPDDVLLDYGTTGLAIVWHPADLGPSSYIVLRNGTSIQSGAWDGSEITVSLDDLDVGLHNFTVVVTDLGGNTASDQVVVTVETASTSSSSATTTTTSGTGTSDPMLMLYAAVAGVAIVLVVVLLFVRSRKS